MNETIENLLQRKSVRVFEDKKISDQEREIIIASAIQAPTAGNQVLYTILDIDDQSVLDALAISCDHQAFIAESKLTLIFCADYQKWYDAFKDVLAIERKPGVGELMLAVSDALIAAQNAVVAAESLGIGSCYIGDIMEAYEYHRELLHLPHYVFPVAMLVFGYPTNQQKQRLKPKRFNEKYIVHKNYYQSMDSQTIKEMFEERASQTPDIPFHYEQWLTAFYNRKFNSDFSREMTRSVNEYIKHFMD